MEDLLNLSSKKECLFLIDSFEDLSKISKEDDVNNEENYQHQEGHFKVNFKDVQNLFKDYDNVKYLKVGYQMYLICLIIKIYINLYT